jgi:succinate-semialdehyde dehydrogenase / glutarate-semialdehyde dehydrogenase
MKQMSRNPWTGEIVAEISLTNHAELEQTLQKTHLAYKSWYKHHAIFERVEPVQRLAQLLRQQRESLALIITQEMGKRYVESLAEIDKCAWLCDVYANHSEAWLEPEHITTESRKSFVQPIPLGVVLLVMPWNFPFWQVIRAAIPTILAGNATILKHASNVPRCALALKTLFDEAGFKEGLFSVIFVQGAEVTPLVSHPYIRGVSLTGSESAGRAVAELAATNFKKVVLELGGSDPFIVLEDANLNLALDTAIQSRFANAGQSCIAAKRFIIDKYHYADFCEALTERIQQLKMGDPMDADTDIAPLARPQHCDELHQQVIATQQAGARLCCGGNTWSQHNGCYEPTLLAEAMPGMTAFDEETFGPVATITKASDIQHAISLANSSHFGLGSTVFTQDSTTAQTVAENLRTGCTYINGLMKSDPRLPFGGTGNSGVGREMGRLGLLEFTNLKTIIHS